MDEVEKGYYNNASEFVRDAIREWLFHLKKQRLVEMVNLARLQVRNGEVSYESAEEITSKIFMRI